MQMHFVSDIMKNIRSSLFTKLSTINSVLCFQMSSEQAEGSCYSQWTLAMLKEQLTLRGLPVKGKKADLIDRYV